MIQNFKVTSQPNNYGTEVEVDGELLNNVLSITYHAEVGETPTVVIKVIDLEGSHIEGRADVSIQKKPIHSVMKRDTNVYRNWRHSRPL